MTLLPCGLLAVGKLVKAVGVRGDLAVLPMTDRPERFRRLTSLFIGAEEQTAEMKAVERSVAGPHGVRIKLKGVDDREAAEHLVGSLLFVDAREHIVLPEGRYFIHEIVGLTVVDEVRGPVGVVREVLKYPAHDVYVIEDKGREFMIPAVKEFVRSIDLASRRMTVRLIEGMTVEE